MVEAKIRKAAQSVCPICGKPTDVTLRPFCSKRCADVDLNRWFSGGYAIASEEEDTPDENDRAKD